ncbi:hypothetical protein MMC26_003191 [Xylographa opegraphella]|nr:hypothetical protein [Xylographa opegraphella]
MPPSLPATRTATIPLPTTAGAGTATTTTTTTTIDSTSPPRRAPVPIGTLRLRAAAAPRRGIRWAEDVVDNEGLGRKSSKVCCIYHKPRAVGESSSESDSSSSESESESDDDDGVGDEGGGTDVGGAAARKRDATDEGASERHHVDGCAHAQARQQKARRRSGNAYERMKKSRKVRAGGVGTVLEK